jgi:hypothetical protein
MNQLCRLTLASTAVALELAVSEAGSARAHDVRPLTAPARLAALSSSTAWLAGSTSAAPALTAAASATTPLPLATGPIHASVDLPLDGFGYMVVDGAHHRVFISGNPGGANDAIVIADYGAHITGSIDGEPAAGGLTIAGDHLYAARCGGGVIDVIDLDTLQKVDSISAAVAGSCDLAAAGGRLWFTTADGALTSVTIAAPHTTVGHGLYPQATFATAANAPGELVLGHRGGSPTTLYAFDVSSGGFSPTGSSSVDAGNLGSIALAADGATVYEASGAPYRGDAFSVPSFAPAGSYPTAPYPTAAAVAPGDGFVSFGGNGVYDPDVWVFPAGSATPLWSFDFGSTADTVYAGGIRFSADGDALLVVSGDGTSAKLTSFSAPEEAPVATALHLTVSKTSVVYGRPVRLDLSLAPAVAEGSVTLTRKTATGVSTTQVTLDANGRATVSYLPRRNTVYTASFDGLAPYLPSAGVSRSVTVLPIIKGRLSTADGRSGPYHLYRYSATCARTHGRGCPSFTATVIPNHHGKYVYAAVQQHTTRGWRTVVVWRKSLSALSRARFPIAYINSSVIGKSFRMVAVFKGDIDHGGVQWGYWYFRITP